MALDARLHRVVARLPNACDGSKSQDLFEYPTRGAPVGRVAAIEHAHCRRAETIHWPDPGQKPAVKTTIIEDDTSAQRAAELRAKKTGGKLGSGTWTWCTQGSRTDDERLGAAVVSKRRRQVRILTPPWNGENGGMRR